MSKIKSKMTQELLHFSKNREHSVETSDVLRRLNESLKIKIDPFKAIDYAKTFYEKIGPAVNENKAPLRIEDMVGVRLPACSLI